jgi:hypothetical protein
MMRYLLVLLMVGNVAMADYKDPIKVGIQRVNPRLPEEVVDLIVADIRQYSVAFNMDPKLIAAVIAQESSFNPAATGSSGEVGLMQLHPRYHTASYNITENILTGVAYLKGLKTTFKHYQDYTWLEHYNRGPNCKTPKKFPYTNRVLKYYVMFGGSLEKTRATKNPQRTKERRVNSRAIAQSN